MNRKLNFGCGSNRLAGWENYDSEVDISKPLPFPDACASHIFAEHVVEHITYQEAFGFFQECYRVLQPGGKIRIAIPDLCEILRHLVHSPHAETYRQAVKKGGHGDGSSESCLRSAMFNHGHKAIWSRDLIFAVMVAAAWRPSGLWIANFHESIIGMNNLEGHGKVVGEIVAEFETGIVEGFK